MNALAKSMETQLRPSSAFSPLLLEPLVEKAISGWESTSQGKSIVSRAHALALLIHKEIEKEIGKVRCILGRSPMISCKLHDRYLSNLTIDSILNKTPLVDQRCGIIMFGRSHFSSWNRVGWLDNIEPHKSSLV